MPHNNIMRDNDVEDVLDTADSEGDTSMVFSIELFYYKYSMLCVYSYNVKIHFYERV